jgi:hypothetical protein
MKTLLAFVFFTLSLFAFSADVTIAWDANAEPDLAGYTLYEKVGGVFTPIANVGVLAEPSYTIKNFTAQQVRTFVVTASNTIGLESIPSNELSIKVPGQPKNIRVK